MKKKIKVVTIVGTRPEIIRLSEVIKTLDSDKDIEHIWYDKDGKQFGKEYGYVIINGQTLYRESVTSYDAKGWRHINIFWIYPDKSRRDKHIWFDGKGERHEEWKK